MEEERKKLLFVFVFSTYIPMFLLKFWLRELVGCAILFYIQRVPTLHTFDGPRYPKNNIYLKKCDDDMSSPNRNLSKNTGRYVKNMNKKSSFLYDRYVNSTIMVDSFYWNSIGSWIPTHKNLLLSCFLIRPILDPKFPLMFKVETRVSYLWWKSHHRESHWIYQWVG